MENAKCILSKPVRLFIESSLPLCLFNHRQRLEKKQNFPTIHIEVESFCYHNTRITYIDQKKFCAFNQLIHSTRLRISKIFNICASIMHPFAFVSKCRHPKKHSTCFSYRKTKSAFLICLYFTNGWNRENENMREGHIHSLCSSRAVDYFEHCLCFFLKHIKPTVTLLIQQEIVPTPSLIRKKTVHQFRQYPSILPTDNLPLFTAGMIITQNEQRRVIIQAYSSTE